MSLLISRHLLARLVLTLAITPAIVAYGQAGEDNNMAPQQSSGATNTVTQNEPPAAGDDQTLVQRFQNINMLGLISPF